MLSSRVADRPAAASLLPFLAALTWFAAQPARAADRVGSESCKGCHATAYRQWLASAHAKASQNLSPVQREDLRCVHCHAPERARAAQDEAPFQRPDRIVEQVEGGVTCETCHGAGAYYSPSYVMRDSELAHAVGLVDPGQKSCLACHSLDSPSLSPFDFAAKVKLIDHWTQEREQRHGSAAEPKPGPRTSQVLRHEDRSYRRVPMAARR